VQRHAELESAVREETEDAAFIAQHRLARDLSRDDHERHLEEQDGHRRDKRNRKDSTSDHGELKENKSHSESDWDVVHAWKRSQLRWKLWWTSERTLQSTSVSYAASIADLGPGRFRLSKWLANAKHSKHNHYALKMAMGVLLLAIPAYLPLGTAGTPLHRFHYRS
jgi:hypothetical protein